LGFYSLQAPSKPQHWSQERDGMGQPRGGWTAWAEKTLILRLTSLPLQAGQVTPLVSLGERTNSSKSPLQDEQWNSKIGIVTSLGNKEGNPLALAR
jgi:hypothetical protein